MGLILEICALINRGVASAYVNESGHLIFVMSDKQEVDLGIFSRLCLKRRRTISKHWGRMILEHWHWPVAR